MSASKPSGWKGKKDDRYWHKDSKYGVRSKCSDCGKNCLGWASDGDSRFHYGDCPRIQGPRREYGARITERVGVIIERHRVPREDLYFTREEALAALYKSLTEQINLLSRQRAQVEAMLNTEEAAS